MPAVRQPSEVPAVQHPVVRADPRPDRRADEAHEGADSRADTHRRAHARADAGPAHRRTDPRALVRAIGGADSRPVTLPCLRGAGR